MVVLRAVVLRVSVGGRFSWRGFAETKVDKSVERKRSKRVECCIVLRRCGRRS